jgi:hypothetical protein
MAQNQARNSLIISIVSFVLCCCGPVAVISLLMGIGAKRDLDRAGAQSGTALAGIIVSIIVIALFVYIYIFNGSEMWQGIQDGLNEAEQIIRSIRL